MPSARWQAIAKIFEAALEKAQGDRKAFVQQACAGDSELESEVAKLLEADQAVGSFLERPAMSGLAPQGSVARNSPLLSCGSVISDRFEILRFIGQGGMGQVYAALDLELRERVAVKAIRPEISSDPHVLSRFRRELQLTRRITHLNVCRTFDIARHKAAAGDDTSSDITFLTMELLEGETLGDLLRRERRLPTGEALPLVLQMIKALGAAHSVGVVHRDFKPSNVLLVGSRDELRLVVTDFGLARAVFPDERLSAENVANSLTGSEGFLGTLNYMAPEQLERGEATTATDIYALGLVMYEMVAGRRPFADAIPFAEVVKRVKEPVPSPKLFAPDLDWRWESAICKCLDREPQARFESVQQLVEEISGVERGVSLLGAADRGARDTVRKNAGRDGKTRRSSWRPRTIGIAAGVLAVALLVLLIRHYQVRKAPLAEGAAVLMTEIRNNTGDERFDGATELMRRQLTQSPYFNLMDPVRIRALLGQMMKSPDSALDPSTAREVALRSGTPRVLFGAVSRIGDSYILDIDIEQPDNNPNRARSRWENHWTWSGGSASASGKEIPSGFLAAVRDGSDWIRSEIGESANDIARVSAPPEDVTTGNWDALSKFAQAEKFKQSDRPDNAIVALQNALAADPRFALAYMRLGDLLVSAGRYNEGYRAYRSALSQEQQQRLTPRERYRLEGIYASDAEDYKAAESSFYNYTVYYPNDYLGWFYRAYPLMMLGRADEAVSSLKKAAALDPARMFAPALIARVDFILERYDDASHWIRHLRDTDHADDADLIEGQLDFLQERYEEGLQHFATLKESQDPQYRSYAFSLLARVYAELGRYGDATEVLQQGMTADLETGDVVRRADKLLDRSYINLKRGRYEASLQDTKLALELDRSLLRSLTAGSLLGRAAGETTGSVKARLTAELRKTEAQLPQGNFKPLSDVVRARLRGEVFLVEGNWKQALEWFRKADSLEAPEKDRECLARGLLAAAQHTVDQAQATSLREEALAAYAGVAREPGRIWQWSMGYPPGYLADETLSYIQAALLCGKVDNLTKSDLQLYLRRRKHADLGLRDVEEANRLALGSMFSEGH
jgi:tRNA A-37 threonylcarbamoyl transferase component Bud32/predicted negative regulator of RcsB-dependent stress response